jgi:hypothetical protein
MLKPAPAFSCVPDVRRPWSCKLVLACVLVLPVCARAIAPADPAADAPAALSLLQRTAADPQPPSIFLPETILSKGFRSPDGLAVDESSGDVYLSDEDASAIYRVRPGGSRELLFDASTPIYEVRHGNRIQAAGLRSPEGLSLDANGRLYVVEDVPGGRLLTFDTRVRPRSSRSFGDVVPIPLETGQVAWEAVDVHPNGGLLLAGSTMEYILGQPEKINLFRGLILHRDPQGEWWLLLNHAMASYSAVCFSRDGQYAMFASEFPGMVGCLDLRTRMVRTFLWDRQFKAPEGLFALPEGSFLMAEESGRVYRLDPTAGTVQLVYQNEGTIESVAWNRVTKRMLLTDDQRGVLVELELKRGQGFRHASGTVQDIPFTEQSTPVEMIPERCPAYLAQVLKLGGYDPRRTDGGLAFQDFARRYCLIAIDAVTQLMSVNRTVEDPIQRLQFVIVAPYLIGYQEGELIWSSSGFTVVQESGRIVKTELVKRQVIQGDLMESRFTPMGGQNIALPMPFSARVSADGFVSVNFLGMGVMADFYLVLDSTEPDNSVMVVVQPDGFVHQYQVRLPPGKKRDHWVMGLERKEPDTWKSLAFPP